MQFLTDLYSAWNKLWSHLTKKTKTPSKLYRFALDWDFTEIMVDEFGEGDWVSAIELLTGPYKGVIYYYTTVKVLEDPENGARISFTYKIHSNPTGVELYNVPEFVEVVIQILDTILRDKPGVEAVSAGDHFHVEP